MWLFENLKARILKSIITWSEMGQQATQAKEVYTELSSICARNCHYLTYVEGVSGEERGKPDARSSFLWTSPSTKHRNSYPDCERLTNADFTFRGVQATCVTFHWRSCGLDCSLKKHSFFYKNRFYKNVEADMHACINQTFKNILQTKSKNIRNTTTSWTK